MKLHGNAALGWNGRRRLAERVVVEGWTLTAAAAAAGISVRCARKWVGRVRARLRRRLQPPRLRGGAGRREDDDRDWLPRASRPLLPAPRHPRRAALDR